MVCMSPILQKTELGFREGDHLPEVTQSGGGRALSDPEPVTTEGESEAPKGERVYPRSRGPR